MTFENPALEIRPVSECSAGLVTRALNRGFEGYVLPFTVTPEAYERRFRAEHLDPLASRVVLRSGEPVAALLVTRRGWTSRIGALGVAPELRQAGVGRRLMELAIQESRSRGDRRIVLEVIEQNPRAVIFYERLGFRRTRRLVGYRRSAAEKPAESAARLLNPIDPGVLLRRIAADDPVAWPWMFAPESLAAAAAPACALSLSGTACALIADPSAPHLSFLALHVLPAARGQGWGRRMLDALSGRYPGRAFVFTVSLPESLVPRFFSRTGWEKLATTQFEMALELEIPATD